MDEVGRIRADVMESIGEDAGIQSVDVDLTNRTVQVHQSNEYTPLDDAVKALVRTKLKTFTVRFPRNNPVAGRV